MATKIQHQEQPGSRVLLQDIVRDIVIGLADGLTVPFALAAGLAGSLPNTRLVVTAGLAEIAAGCIAMGLGAYLAVMSDHDYFHAELSRREQRIQSNPEEERDRLMSTLKDAGIPQELAESIVGAISKDKDQWLRIVMKSQGVEHPSRDRARNSALTIGLSYILGGMIPLSPYCIVASSREALAYSIVITLCALFAFGIAKARILGTAVWKSAVQTALVGGLAATVAFAAAKWIA